MFQKIDALLQKIVDPEKGWHITLISNWNSIIGPLHTKVQLEKIDGSTLVLGVFDSCWLQELYLLSPLLLKTINQNLDEPHVKQLRFKKIARIQKKEVKQKMQSAKKEVHVELSIVEKHALQNVSDAELKIALKNFLLRCYQER